MTGSRRAAEPMITAVERFLKSARSVVARRSRTYWPDRALGSDLEVTVRRPDRHERIVGGAERG